VFLCWKPFSITVKKSNVSEPPTFSIITSLLSLRSMLHLPGIIYGHIICEESPWPIFSLFFFKGGEPFIITRPMTKLQTISVFFKANSMVPLALSYSFILVFWIVQKINTFLLHIWSMFMCFAADPTNQYMHRTAF